MTPPFFKVFLSEKDYEYTHKSQLHPHTHSHSHTHTIQTNKQIFNIIYNMFLFCSSSSYFTESYIYTCAKYLSRVPPLSINLDFRAFVRTSPTHLKVKKWGSIHGKTR